MIKEVLKMALEAFESIFASTHPYRENGTCTINDKSVELSNKAIAGIKEALAQPELWEKFCDSNCVWTDHHPDCKLSQRTWDGLTDEEIELLDLSNYVQVVRIVEQALKEKNA